MPISLTTNADDILNRVAVECGLEPTVGAFSRTDAHWVQLRYLLQTAGEELASAYPWEFLAREHQIVTGPADDNEYDLPADFAGLLDQTAWDRSNNVPIFGPLSAQDWTYLRGRNLQAQTIYAQFRITDGKFKIFPEEVPEGLDLNFEYQSTQWNTDGAVPPTYSDTVSTGSDKPLFDRTLITRYLKVKWLEAKGFDTSKAQDDFVTCFNMITSKDKGADTLYMDNRHRGVPYLDALRNTPDWQYGSWS